MSVSYQLRINSSFFQRIENVLAHVVATSQGKIVVIVAKLVDSGPLRCEHWKGQLYDVKISRHLNLHWGQQTSFFGPIRIFLGQQHAVGRLVGILAMKMQNTKSEICFLKVRLYVLTKNGLLYCYKLGNILDALCCLYAHHQLPNKCSVAPLKNFYP